MYIYNFKYPLLGPIGPHRDHRVSELGCRKGPPATDPEVSQYLGRHILWLSTSLLTYTYMDIYIYIYIYTYIYFFLQWAQLLTTSYTIDLEDMQSW